MIIEQMTLQVEELIRQQQFHKLDEVLAHLAPSELGELLEELSREDAPVVFQSLSSELAVTVFKHLPHDSQITLIESLPPDGNRVSAFLNALSPDDRTAFFAELPEEALRRFLALLNPKELDSAIRLLGYPEDSVGRLATTDYIALRPDWTVEQALRHIRRFGRESETINVIYIVDQDWRLLDDIRIRDILLANTDMLISELMDNRFVVLNANDDQEEAVAVFGDHDRGNLPVVDANGVLVGIVTVDDVLDVAEEEATEDIQKLGGSEALQSPYLETPLHTLIRKRAGWLAVLFVGEMFTASAMGYFQDEIASAVVLTLFLPLVISSGGNTGSQAASIMIRALALDDVGLRDWWRVMRREVVSGLALGGILGLIGFMRIVLWSKMFGVYGDYPYLLGVTLGISLVGVVLWGTITGSMLPFVMQRFGIDPATSSAPFVATLVDVTGVIIYFGTAAVILSGTLL